MPDLVISGRLCGGRAVRMAPAAGWLAPQAIETFAQRNRKALRFLNRGSTVTAALIDALLAARWPDPEHRPAKVALVVGSAFGNQGETTRYFRAIHALGPDQVSPMASFDVAVNAFVSFCSIFFRCTGTVQTLSSGAVSGADAIVAGGALLEAGDADAVLVVGVEQEAPETRAYAGAPEDPGEAAGVLLLERAAPGVPVLGHLLGADVAFAGAERTSPVLAALADRLLASHRVSSAELHAIVAGPPWTETLTAARRAVSAPNAAWLDGTTAAGRCQVGATAMVGCGLVLDALARDPGYAGLVLTGDPRGWLGAVLLATFPSRPAGRSA